MKVHNQRNVLTFGNRLKLPAKENLNVLTIALFQKTSVEE